MNLLRYVKFNKLIYLNIFFSYPMIDLLIAWLQNSIIVFAKQLMWHYVLLIIDSPFLRKDGYCISIDLKYEYYISFALLQQWEDCNNQYL